MRCPRCMFVGESIDSLCPQCGYKLVSVSSGPLHPHTLQPITSQPITPPPIPSVSITRQPIVEPSTTKQPTTSPLVHEYTLMRGDVLGQGRYRLTEPVPLPKNHQGQGVAWLATDTHSSRHRVLLRKIEFPIGFRGNPQEIVNSIATRLQNLSSYPGFPNFLDVFQEQGSYYFVLEHPVGETLAALIKHQGGALPERDIAEYGQQLCEILSVLANQQPPLIHGGISPKTIIVNPETRQASLTLLPLFPLQPLPKDNTLPGYLAPEQIRGNTLPSSDLYSLTATLHYAITGYEPHDRLAFFHPPARRLNPIVTHGMDAILACGLRLSVPQRYPHPADMHKELSALIASYPPIEVLPQQNNLPRYPQSPLTGKNNIGIAIIISTCLIILFLLLIAVPPLLGPSKVNNNAIATATSVAQQAALNTQLSLEMQSFRKKGIGLSDGRLAFDTYQGRGDTNLKQQAATALQQGNLSVGVNFLNQAVNADPTDG
ncbi:MAG TPA: hypothetical protein VHV10_03260, partial [Ktedonobacteraceae bacterium]|nr:hypothetical protein [Ktedonobacteraceae bacterium]